MNPPPISYTLRYFSRLGYTVEQVTNRYGGKEWKIFGDDLPLDGRTFPSLLLLWAEWMDYSAERIYEDAMARQLRSIWTQADEQGRAELAAELEQSQEGNPSARIRAIWRKAGSNSPDRLPRDWKRRMAFLFKSKRQLWPVRFLIETMIEQGRAKTTPSP